MIHGGGPGAALGPCSGRTRARVRLGNGSLGMPGCLLLVRPDVVTPLANGAGSAVFALAIPNAAAGRAEERTPARALLGCEG